MKVQYLLFIPLLALLVSCEKKPSSSADTPEQMTQTTLASSHEGGKLHEEKCQNCHIVKHDANLYQRENSKVKSYERLQSQVRLCNANLNLELFDEDMTMIGEYLNATFYNFPTN